MKNELYRGYWIKHTLTGETWVEKDGFKIAWAKSDAHARTLIDGLLD